METTTLPAATSLDGLWAELNQPFDGQYSPQGIYRRLAAGLSSAADRGFTAENFRLTRDTLIWESPGGVWSHRPWKVTANLPATAILSIVVGSGSSSDRTEFVGPALTAILLPRLRLALAVVAARAGCVPSDWEVMSVADDEWHDIHGGVDKRWMTASGVVELTDCPYGRGDFVGRDLTTSESSHMVVAGISRVADQEDLVIEWKGVGWTEYREVYRGPERYVPAGGVNPLGRWAAAEADEPGQPGWVRASTVRRDGFDDVKSHLEGFVPNDATPAV